MPAYRAISWRKFVQVLRKAGFEGPFPGGKHQFMVRNGLTFTIPNPHPGDIGIDLLKRLLNQLDMTREEWEKL